jgi:hypothetical protein
MQLIDHFFFFMTKFKVVFPLWRLAKARLKIKLIFGRLLQNRRFMLSAKSPCSWQATYDVAQGNKLIDSHDTSIQVFFFSLVSSH